MYKYLIITLTLILISFCNGEAQNEEIKVESAMTIGAGIDEENKHALFETKDFPAGPVAKLLSYRNKELSREVTITKTGSNRMVVETSYDDQQRVKILTTKNNKNWRKQKNEYLRDDLLVSELVVEYDGEQKISTSYTYEYPETISNPLTFYRFRDGEKVTEMKLTTTDDKEVLEERALFPGGKTNIITTTKIKNKNGNVIEEYVQLISSIGSESTQLDTTQMSPTTYEYDRQGNILKKYSTDLFGNATITQNYYDKNRYLRRKKVTQNGQLVLDMVLEEK